MRPAPEPRRPSSPGKRVNDLRRGTIDGAIWLRRHGSNCDVVIAYQGAIVDEAIAAAGIIGGISGLTGTRSLDPYSNVQRRQIRPRGIAFLAAIVISGGPVLVRDA